MTPKSGTPTGLTLIPARGLDFAEDNQTAQELDISTLKSAGTQHVNLEAGILKVVKSAIRMSALSVAAALIVNGCSRNPDAPALQGPAQSSDSEAPEIERYRAALVEVTESRDALALEVARFNDEDLSGVVKRSLGHAGELQGRIERLMEFDEAASAAATLREHVASLQRQLKGIDAESLQSTLPDLLLTNESIQSAMDELTDLAAPGPEEMPVHDHDLAGESDL